MNHLAHFTYANKDFTSFFSFSSDQDLINLNKFFFKVIKDPASYKELFLFLHKNDLNTKQVKYLNTFLQAFYG
jgi:hypothetical protein